MTVFQMFGIFILFIAVVYVGIILFLHWIYPEDNEDESEHE